MIWLPRTTDISTYFAQSLEIRGIESRLYLLYKLCNLIMCVQIALKLGISMIHTWHKFIFNRFNDKFKS